MPTVLIALVLRSTEDLADARDRADALRAAARCAPFALRDALDHVARRWPQMTAADRATVARWLAAGCP